MGKIRGDLLKVQEILLAANEVAHFDWGVEITPEHIIAMERLRGALARFTGKEIIPC